MSVTSVGNGIGPGTSAWRWYRYAPVIPHWWQLTFARSRAGTRPSTHTATAPTRRSSIWYSSVRPTITPGGTPGQETPSLPTRDASGATWNGLGRVMGRWPALLPPTGNERERERVSEWVNKQFVEHVAWLIALKKLCSYFWFWREFAST